ncbi:unnamed protein product [Agarophyton chilense]
MAVRAAAQLWRFRVVALSAHPRSRAVASRADQPQLNEALLKHASVRLVSESGADRGLMSPQQALREARMQHKDLMQITTAKPIAVGTAPLPVVRILDYASFEEHRQKKRYKQHKAVKQQQMQQRKHSVLKQIRFSPLTDRNDMRIKLKHAAQFLIDGYRVKIYMQFRRGQRKYEATAKQSLTNAALALAPFGTCQALPTRASIQQLFAPQDEQQPDAQRPNKPLEVVFQPLPKAQREKLTIDALTTP